MMGWRVFYRILGLPEEMTDPNYYDLLGISPDQCNPQRVQQAFQERQQLLRSNIPGGHFIPLVMKFEAEELSQAVSILGNDQKRQVYDDYLKHESHKDLAANVKKHRQLVIQAAKTVVSGELNKDGTLDQAKRPVIAERLGYLGFTENGIKMVLDGIPMAVEEPETLADEEMEEFVDVVLGLVEDEGYKDTDLEDQDNLEDSHQNNKDKAARGRGIWKIALLWVLSLIIPFATILFFTLFLMYTNQKISERRESLNNENKKEILAPKETADDNKGREAKNQKPDETELDNTSVADISIPTISENVTDIMKSWSKSSQPNDMLADIAMTLLGCCDRVDRIAINYSVYGTELERLLNIQQFSDRKYALIGNVRQAGRFSSYSQTANALAQSHFRLLLNENCKQLEEQLSSDDQALHYQAIETLRIYDTPQASQILLNVLHDRNDIEPQMAGRILRAFGNMSDPLIPQSLAIILQKPKRILVRPITQTLAKINDLEDESPQMCPGIVPYSFTSTDLKRASKWWNNYYTHGAAYHRSSSARAAMKKPQMGDLESEILDLIKVIDYYGGMMADTLSDYRRKDKPSGQVDDSKDYIPVDPDETTPFRSMGRIVGQCLRLVRTHQAGKKWAVQIDMIEMDRQRRLALCQTNSQKAVVNLDTIRALLAIIIEQTDQQGQYHQAVKLIQDDWKNISHQDMNNVIEEMRLSAYYNLMLWDLLTQCMGQ